MAPKWDVIKSEYLGGGISQRKLAEKHGVNADVLMQRANRERWKQERDEVISKAAARTQQKVANAITNNATIAQRIKTKLLRKLEQEIDQLPASMGTEMDQNISNYTYEEDGGKKGSSRIKQRTDGGKRYSLRDLTIAYKNLVGDTDKGIDAEDDPLLEVLKRWDDASAGK